MKESSDISSIFPPRLDDGEGPARSLPEDAEEALIRGALEQCGLASAKTTTEEEVEARERSSRVVLLPGRRLRKRGLRGAIVLGLVGSTTLAAAFTIGGAPLRELWQQGWGAVWGGAKTTARRAPEPLAGQAATPGVVIVPAKPATGALGSAPPKDSAEPQPLLRAPSSVARGTTPRAGARELSRESFSPKAPVRRPEDLLSAANALRAERRFDQALASYLKVLRQHPGSPQALAARVAAGTLRLEHAGDPRGAQALLRGAAKGPRAVPEALYSLAQTHRATGERRKERVLLRRFLAKFAEHPLATTARHRLAQLGATPGQDANEVQR